eukprot:IDg4922t1
MYHDTGFLMLDHCFYLSSKLYGLRVRKKDMHDKLMDFAERFCTDILEATGEQQIEETKQQLRIVYCTWTEAKITLEFELDNPVLHWNHSIDFYDSSPLLRVDIRIISLPAHAADLERIWSDSKLILSSKRSSFLSQMSLKALQLKIAQQQEHSLDEKRL